MNELRNGWPSTMPRTFTSPRVPKNAAESGITRELNHELEIVSIPDTFGTAARAITIGGSVHHKVMDLFKIKTQLGYRDPMPAAEAIAKTSHWYVANQPGTRHARARHQRTDGAPPCPDRWP